MGLEKLHSREREREREFHLFLQADTDDGGSLAAVQRWPLSHVSPGRHRELAAVLVAHDLLLPGQTNQDCIGNVISQGTEQQVLNIILLIFLCYSQLTVQVGID